MVGRDAFHASTRGSYSRSATRMTTRRLWAAPISVASRPLSVIRRPRGVIGPPREVIGRRAGVTRGPHGSYARPRRPACGHREVDPRPLLPLSRRLSFVRRPGRVERLKEDCHRRALALVRVREGVVRRAGEDQGVPLPVEVVAQMTSSGREMTSSGREMTSSGREMTSSGREMTAPGREMTSTRRAMTASRREVIPCGYAMTS
jgi:hypothetical protein